MAPYSAPGGRGNLIEAMRRLHDSQNKVSGRLIFLTWVLAILTAVLVVLTVAMIFVSQSPLVK